MEFDTLHLSPEISAVLLAGAFLLLVLFGTLIVFLVKRGLDKFDDRLKELTASITNLGTNLVNVERDVGLEVSGIKHEIQHVKRELGQLDRLNSAVVEHDRRIQKIEDAGCDAYRSRCVL